MNATGPDVSIVLATRDRPDRLGAMLESLRGQTLGPERFEVIVVDDASGDETRELLEREAAREGMNLSVIRHERSRGPAVARNTGWRAARSELVAFTDDDCVAAPDWAERGLRMAAASPGAIVQGWIDAIPEEDSSYGPFSHTVRVHRVGPSYETANIFYPRSLLERLGGFDEQEFSAPGGEDTDLAWRAIEAGVTPVFAKDARVYHAVTHLGPVGKLRLANRWHESMLPFKRHPGLREHLVRGVFWNPVHYQLARAALALAVPRRLWPLRWLLAAPYVVRLTARRSGPLLAPYFILHDLVEVAACLRGSARYKTFVI